MRRYNPELADFDPVEHLGLVDRGDVRLTPSRIDDAFARIQTAVRRIHDAGTIPVTMGDNGLHDRLASGPQRFAPTAGGGARPNDRPQYLFRRSSSILCCSGRSIAAIRSSCATFRTLVDPGHHCRAGTRTRSPRYGLRLSRRTHVSTASP